MCVRGSAILVGYGDIGDWRLVMDKVVVDESFQ